MKTSSTNLGIFANYVYDNSFRSFDMLEPAIAKISIEPLYQGLKENHNEFVIE